MLLIKHTSFTKVCIYKRIFRKIKMFLTCRVESKTSSARSGIEKRNSAEVANANGDDTISKGNQTRGARLASVQIETGAAC